jgi:hypothetical protein
LLAALGAVTINILAPVAAVGLAGFLLVQATQ